MICFEGGISELLLTHKLTLVSLTGLWSSIRGAELYRAVQETLASQNGSELDLWGHARHWGLSPCLPRQVLALGFVSQHT